MAQQLNLAVANVRVGGRDYPVVSQRNCRTCCSPHRADVEQQALTGRTWKAISGSLPADAGLTGRHLADHWRNNHVPVKEATVRELVDRQAEQRGVVIEAAVEHAVDHLEFSRSILGRVHRRVLAGELEPDLRDGLRAAELLARYDPGPQVDESTYVEAFAIFHEAAASIMTTEQTSEMSQRLSQHPRLRELALEWEETANQ